MIKIYFKGVITIFELIEKEYLYQWDINQKIKVKDETITEIHYCNRTSNCSLVVAVVDGVADVPNILLQDSRPIRVYGYDGESTKHEALLKVVARSKPADYVYTETEVKRYEDLEKRIEAIEKNGGSGVDLSDYYTKAETDKEIAEAVVNAGGGGSIDLDNYYTKTETDTEIDTAIEDVLAKVGGGSGGTWRKIRTVIIPEDITTDTSGVAFAEQPNGGVIFAFDTDENGNSFDITEIYIYGQVSKAGGQFGEFGLGTLTQPIAAQGWIATSLSVGNAGSKAISWAHSVCVAGGTVVSYRSQFGGGGINNVTSNAKILKSNVGGTSFKSFNAFLANGGGYGFEAGSTFDFYGR